MPKYTPEQQKEHRRLWVQALRSGKYAQYLGYLHTNGGFCCLGVACDISGLGEWYKLYDRSCFSHYKISEGYQYHTKLPIEVRNWLGLNSGEGIFSFDGMPEELKSESWIRCLCFDIPISLGSLNDRGVDFDRIATVIETAEENPDMNLINNST